jgi:predicted porin
MQKKLIALAVAGLAAAPMFAQAQSAVTLYGRVDMSYINRTHDQKSATIDEESSNRWGIMGQEDLGNGLSAVFDLQNRFTLDNGRINGEVAADTTTYWKEVAQVGLKSNTFGTFLFGRPRSAGYTTIGGDGGFAGDTIGTFATRRGKITNTWDNAVRYESNQLGPIGIVASFGLPETASSDAGGNNGKNRYGIAVKGTFGGFRAEGSYQHDTVKDENEALGTTKTYALTNPWNTVQADFAWNLGAVELFSTNSWSRGWRTDVNSASSATNTSESQVVRWLVGAKIPVGQGAVQMNFGHGIERTHLDAKANSDSHAGLGYWYNLSKRTMVDLNLAWDDKKESQGVSADGVKNSTQWSTQLGLRHTF